MADAKYIRFKELDDGQDVIVMFPSSVTHETIAKALKAIVISAGFVSPHGECYGKSVSLDIGSNKMDSRLLKLQYRLGVFFE